MSDDPSPSDPSTNPAPPDGPRPGPGPHRRRPRYSGRNPRRFEEKYKELQPEKYAGDIGKILASGKTPAGMHRPILVAEILEVLNPQPGEQAVDCTLGYGGHATELLRRVSPGGCLLGLDVDPIEMPKTVARLRTAGYDESCFLSKASNFAGLKAALTSVAWEGADVVLADLGVSSMQIDDPERGFTFKVDAPLDLRMNPKRGIPASEWLARVSVAQLETALAVNSDEPHAAVLARGLVNYRARSPILRTVVLAEIVRKLVTDAHEPGNREDPTDSVRRVFQALRIEVNDEFSALDTWLRQLPSCLKSGGRVAVLTFHSGEDRRVKQAFREGQREGVYSFVNREVVVAGPEERRANPRSTSAKLRWAIRS